MNESSAWRIRLSISFGVCGKESTSGEKKELDRRDAAPTGV